MCSKTNSNLIQDLKRKILPKTILNALNKINLLNLLMTSNLCNNKIHKGINNKMSRETLNNLFIIIITKTTFEISRIEDNLINNRIKIEEMSIHKVIKINNKIKIKIKINIKKRKKRKRKMRKEKKWMQH